MYRVFKYFFLFLIVCSQFSSANNDSLVIKLKNAENDSAKIEILIKAVSKKSASDPDIDSLLGEIKKYSASRDCFIRAFVFLKTGTYYAVKENPGKALENLIIALRIGDSCGNKYIMMNCRARLAYVYKVNSNFKDAIKNSHYSLSYARLLKDSIVMAENYTLLGNMYKTEMQLDSALYYHTLVLGIRERRNDKFLLSLTYNNLGLVHKNRKDYKKALFYLRKSLVLKQEIADKSVYSAYNNMSIVYKHLRMIDSALFYSRLVIAEGIKYKNGRALTEGLTCMAEAYEVKKDFEAAYFYSRRIKSVEDSLGKEKLTAVQLELQSKYESDKKDSEIKLKEESLKTAEALNSKKNVLIGLSSLALLLAVIAGIFIFRSYRQSKENAVQLSTKNREIEEKNKEITDSIAYARNIQHSLLTSKTVFEKNIREHFILYLPKDIVSGDFYWAENSDDAFLVLCGDCTGHGVPGAFMSLLGISHISEIVNRENINLPDKILNRLRERMIGSFALNNNKDGMDASLIKIKNGKLEVAAANNPVWVIRGKQNHVIAPDKFPIGNQFGEKQPFTLNSYDLENDDLIILLTDGFADQFGGPKNKKFKYKQLEKVILENSNLPLTDIRNLLENYYLDWKGKNEQIDDILIIGLKI